MSDEMLFGIGGFAYSGKDTLADLLNVHAGFHKTYMSKPLEQALLALDPWVNDEDTLPVRYSAIHEQVGYDESKKHPEVRRLLQVLGTEVGRNMIDPNVWCWPVRTEITECFNEGTPVAVTGIRYENELEMIESFGGVAVWVDRPGFGPVNQHSSDNSLGPQDFDIAVTNDGTIEDLKQKALQLVVQHSDLTVVDFDTA